MQIGSFSCDISDHTKNNRVGPGPNVQNLRLIQTRPKHHSITCTAQMTRNQVLDKDVRLRAATSNGLQKRHNISLELATTVIGCPSAMQKYLQIKRFACFGLGGVQGCNRSMPDPNIILISLIHTQWKICKQQSGREIVSIFYGSVSVKIGSLYHLTRIRKASGLTVEPFVSVNTPIVSEEEEEEEEEESSQVKILHS